MVLYFTGTGNSAYIAKKIAAMLQDEVLCINDRIKKSDCSPVESQKPWVFVLPTYGWRIPRVAEHWIAMTELCNSSDTYFVMNCGSDIGNAEKYLAALIRKKQLSFKGVKGIVMPENYIAYYPVPDPVEAKRIIEHAEPYIEECVDAIIHKASFQKQIHLLPIS